MNTPCQYTLSCTLSHTLPHTFSRPLPYTLSHPLTHSHLLNLSHSPSSHTSPYFHHQSGFIPRPIPTVSQVTPLTALYYYMSQPVNLALVRCSHIVDDLPSLFFPCRKRKFPVPDKGYSSFNFAGDGQGSSVNKRYLSHTLSRILSQTQSYNHPIQAIVHPINLPYHTIYQHSLLLTDRGHPSTNGKCFHSQCGTLTYQSAYLAYPFLPSPPSCFPPSLDLPSLLDLPPLLALPLPFFAPPLFLSYLPSSLPPQICHGTTSRAGVPLLHLPHPLYRGRR